MKHDHKARYYFDPRERIEELKTICKIKPSTILEKYLLMEIGRELKSLMRTGASLYPAE